MLCILLIGTPTHTSTASQAFVKQIKNGEHYKLLQPVYGLGIVAYIYDKASENWYHHYQLVKAGEAVSSDVIEHLQLIFIELPKFPVHSHTEKKLRLLWLRFLREIDGSTNTISAELLTVPELAQAIALAEESAYTPDELRYYESYWDQVRRDKTVIIDSYEQGRERDVEQGIEKIALNMLKINRSLDEISLLTGLSTSAIMQLKQKAGY